MVGSNQARNGRLPTQLRVFSASVLSWIKDQYEQGDGGFRPADPVAADGTGTRTDGTQLAFYGKNAPEDRFLRPSGRRGGKPDTIMTGSFNKQAFFRCFTGRATPFEGNQSRRRSSPRFSAYESDFGDLKGGCQTASSVPATFLCWKPRSGRSLT